MRLFPPRAHACAARRTLAANTLAGGSGIAVMSGRSGLGPRLVALAQAVLAQATRLGRGHRHRDAAIMMNTVLQLYLGEGRPLTDPMVCKAHLYLAHIAFEIAAENAASPGRSPARHLRIQDRCAVVADYHRQQIGAGASFVAVADAEMAEVLAQRLPALLVVAAARGIGTGAVGQTGVEHVGDTPLAASWWDPLEGVADTDKMYPPAFEACDFLQPKGRTSGMLGVVVLGYRVGDSGTFISEGDALSAVPTVVGALPLFGFNCAGKRA